MLNWLKASNRSILEIDSSYTEVFFQKLVFRFTLNMLKIETLIQFSLKSTWKTAQLQQLDITFAAVGKA